MKRIRKDVGIDSLIRGASISYFLFQSPMACNGMSGENASNPFFGQLQSVQFFGRRLRASPSVTTATPGYHLYISSSRAVWDSLREGIRFPRTSLFCA